MDTDPPSRGSTFGARLKAIRVSKGWDMRQARDRTGFSRSHLLCLETDERAPGIETLRRLSDGYGVPIEELATEEERLEADARWQTTLNRLLGPDSYLPEEEKERLRRMYRPRQDPPEDA